MQPLSLPAPTSRVPPLPHQVLSRVGEVPGCLGACLLGTTDRVQPRVWIPTSMILPIGALLQVGPRAGLDCSETV